MSVRDASVDSGRMGAPAQNRADFLVPMDFCASTIDEQNDLGGHNKADLPVGGPPPMQEHSVGSAGDMDMDSDPDY